MVGIVGLLGLVVLRLVETKRNARFFEPSRAALDRVASRAYRLLVFGEIPTTYRAWAASRARALTHQSVVFLVGLLRSIERPLSRLNHRLRASNRSAQVPSRDPSPFLKGIREGSDENGKNTQNQLESNP